MTFLDEFLGYIANNNQAVIEKLLIEDPKLIEEADEHGVVPAFIAAKKGHYELVRYMMECTRVSMNVVDCNNQSILHYAAISNNEECFKYLVDRIGMDPYIVNKQMESPLDIAYKHNASTIIDYYDKHLNITRENIYYNPVVPGTYPDPSIVRVCDDFYMVNSSFFYFPCIPIQHSKDLIHWHTIGHAVTDTKYIDLTNIQNGRGFWAPDISYSRGKFYITATFRMNDDDALIRRQMIVSADKPEGPYSKPIYIDVDGIDPSLFTDDDGKRYMLLNRGARIFEISHEGDEILSEPKMLWYGDNKRAPEAPHLLKHNGYYYCFVSEGGTGVNHQISVARSRNIDGPYESCPYNPIMKQKNPKHPIQRSGHGKLVSTQNNEWYIVYLCGRMVNDRYSILGRETCLDKVIWTNDGWPMINNNNGPSGFAKKPNLKSYHCKGTNDSNDWVFVRTTEEKYIEVNDEHITMIAGNYDLDTLKARNIMLKRQTMFKFVSRVHIEVDLNDTGIEAGITCYYDTDTYLKYFITKEDNQVYLNVTERIGTENIQSIHHLVEYNGSIELKIVTKFLSREFYYRIGKSKWLSIGCRDNVYYLCDEGIQMNKRFTGAMIGIYTLDKNKSNQVKVKFSQMIIEGVC